MVLIRCDINTCKKEIPVLSGKKARLMEKEYDLCEDCFNSLQSFISKRLSDGIIPFETTQKIPNLADFKDVLKPSPLIPTVDKWPIYPHPSNPIVDITWNSNQSGISIPFNELIGQVEKTLTDMEKATQSNINNTLLPGPPTVPYKAY